LTLPIKTLRGCGQRKPLAIEKSFRRPNETSRDHSIELASDLG
jgi:hypothetical protein